MINVFEPDLGKTELRALRDVFESNWIGKGEKVDKFELEFARFLNIDKHNLISTTSCTEALFQIFDLLKEDDDRLEVILPSNSFVGVANSIIANGFKPIFCDIDCLSGNTNLRLLEKFISKKTLAIVVQHFGGRPCDIFPIKELCDQKDIYLIEDSAGSVASKKNEINCGTIGDFGVWSFDAMKMIVTGDGGMIYAKNQKHIVKLQKQLYLGLDAFSGAKSSISHDRWWEFDVQIPARRSIMNDISGALGIIQLQKIDQNVAKREKNAQFYDEALESVSKDIQILAPVNHPDKNSFYFYPLFVTGNMRDSLAKFLRDKGVYTTYRYYGLHNIALYGSRDKELEGIKEFSEKCILLPQHSKLRKVDLTRITGYIFDFFNQVVIRN